MDKRVVLAVAGAGKTTYIIDQLKEDSRALLVTYTDNNTRGLKNKVIKKFGCIPEGIKILSYFKFLYSCCFKPLCGYELKAKGVNFEAPLLMRGSKNQNQYYFDTGKRIYSNRLALYLMHHNKMQAVIGRLERYFEHIFIDEVQDFSSYDFDFLCQLINGAYSLKMVGDFYQKTFATSRDGNKGSSLFSDYNNYTEELIKNGFDLDVLTLLKSHRCPPEICDFIADNLDIHIESHKTISGNIEFIDSDEDIDALFKNDSVVKLFYQSSNKYPGNTDNWGNVKGLDDFEDVCVVLNPTTLRAYKNNTLSNLALTTKNKFYVACTRTKRNLYFIDEANLKKYKND